MITYILILADVCLILALVLSGRDNTKKNRRIGEMACERQEQSRTLRYAEQEKVLLKRRNQYLREQIEALKDKEPEVRLAYDSSTGRLWDKTTGFDLGNCREVTINESADNVTTAQIVIVLERSDE